MNMIGLVRNEWKKVFLPVLLTTVLLAIAMSVLSCTIYQNYVLHYDLEAWEVGTELFSLLYPLFVVVPLCWNLYYERKNNFLLYVMPRVKIKKYLTAKWIAYALGTLCIIVIPYILSAVFALYVKTPVVPFVENPFRHPPRKSVQFRADEVHAGVRHDFAALVNHGVKETAIVDMGSLDGFQVTVRTDQAVVPDEFVPRPFLNFPDARMDLYFHDSARPDGGTAENLPSKS